MDLYKLLVFSFWLVYCKCVVTQINIPINTRYVFVDSCSGLTSGMYPSCTSCTKFVTCTNGIYGTFPCPPGTMFDPGAGMCSASATCNLASLSTANTPNPSPRVTHMDKPKTTASTTITTSAQSRVIVINGRGFSKRITFETGCIRNCYGQGYGFYPSCYGCDRVVICKPYNRRIARCYYHGYKWDDHSKGCRPTSSTCQEKIYYTPWRYWYYSYGRK